MVAPYVLIPHVTLLVCEETRVGGQSKRCGYGACVYPSWLPASRSDLALSDPTAVIYDLRQHVNVRKNVTWHLWTNASTPAKRARSRSTHRPSEDPRRVDKLKTQVPRPDAYPPIQAHLPSKAINPAPRHIVPSAPSTSLIGARCMYSLNMNSWAMSSIKPV